MTFLATFEHPVVPLKEPFDIEASFCFFQSLSLNWTLFGLLFNFIDLLE